MFLKPRKASTDPRLRSLLQKAARRGAGQVLEATVQILNDIGDRTWLRSRTVVITFEECWPIAEKLSLTKQSASKVDALLEVVKATKQKDAAGLGALAYAFHEGDRSMLDLAPSSDQLRQISEALTQPQAFFDRALNQCSSDSSRRLVGVARQYLAAATWAWDKACILAGALLAATNGVPQVPPVTSRNESDFPFWVALDKHTPQGKDALQLVAAKLGAKYNQLIWASFYFESASVNAEMASPWFEAERRWRLRKSGLTVQAAAELWQHVRASVKAELASSADALRETVNGRTSIQRQIFT